MTLPVPTISDDHRLGRNRDQRGFTLVELMVVVLIIGILLGIAIPTFLGARSRSQDGVAKASLRTALTAAQIVYTDRQTFSGATAPTLARNEGSITFVNSPTVSDGPKRVSGAAAAQTWAGAARSQSGTCFLIRATSTGAVTYGSVTGGACTGAVAAARATGTEW